MSKYKKDARILTAIMLGVNAFYCWMIFHEGSAHGELRGKAEAYQEVTEKINEILNGDEDK